MEPFHRHNVSFNLADLYLTINISELNKNTSIPKWLKPYMNSFKTFAIDMTQCIGELKGRMTIQKTVTGIVNTDRENRQNKINLLEDELDSLQQYTRRLLFHGIKETGEVNTEKGALGVIESMLDAGITENVIARTHCLGRKKDEGKPRTIIIKFASHRQRKKVSDSKKKQKGQTIVITENVPGKR